MIKNFSDKYASSCASQLLSSVASTKLQTIPKLFLSLPKTFAHFCAFNNIPVPVNIFEKMGDKFVFLSRFCIKISEKQL